MNKKKLPIGIQTFSEIREEQYAYVDKTGSGHKPDRRRKILFSFPAAPFGKSLLISTLQALFEGEKICLLVWLRNRDGTGAYVIRSSRSALPAWPEPLPT